MVDRDAAAVRHDEPFDQTIEADAPMLARPAGIAVFLHLEAESRIERAGAEVRSRRTDMKFVMQGLR